MKRKSVQGVVMILGLWSLFSSSASARNFHRPYKDDSTNVLYNLIFCDDLDSFRSKDSKPTGPLAVLLSKDAPVAEVERIAKDEKQESRVRVLAFNQLKAKHRRIDKRELLGVVVEVPLDGGLDTLAVFADGRMRYINHTGKVAIFEATPAALEELRKNLLRASEGAIAKIGPWDKPRRPPPAKGSVRLSFLVSDGLYFGEGPFETIARDAIGGPVLDAATQLFSKIVSTSTK